MGADHRLAVALIRRVVILVGGMKVLHLITRLILGGAQENTVLTCEGLASRGHDVTLAFGPIYGPEGSLLERARRGGYRLVELPAMVREVRPWTDWRCYRQCRRLIRELKPDVVHTHSSKAGIVGRAAAWAEGVPAVVHTIHGLPFHPYQPWIVNRLYVAAERWAARRCHAIATVADAMTRQALAAGVGRPEQYVTVYSGMEIEPFVNGPTDRATIRRELGLSDDDLVLGTVARLAELKGHDDLLDALWSVFNEKPAVMRAGHAQRQRDTTTTAGITTRAGLEVGNDVPGAIAGRTVVIIRGDELGTGLSDEATRKAAWAFAKDKLLGTSALNLHTGRHIHIGREGIKKALNNTADIRRAQVFPALPEMLRLARLDHSEAPVNKPQNIRAYHHFDVDALFGGTPIRFHLTVREDNNGNWYYNHHIKKEASPAYPGGAALPQRTIPAIGEAYKDRSQSKTGGQYASVKLLWVGDGWWRPRIEEKVRHMGLENRIVVTGLVPPDRIPAMLRAMDILIHPSYREGLARALPQALLAGVPVISYDCDGAGEVCIEGQTGKLVPTGDLDALREATQWMIDHPDARRAMAQRGRDLCAQRFDHRVMAEQLEALYTRLLGRGSC